MFNFFKKKQSVKLLLIEKFEDNDMKVRKDAADTLIFNVVFNKEPPPIDELLEALEKDSSYTRECAAYVLGSIGDKRALKPLRNVYIKDPVSSVVNRASEALDKLIVKFKLSGNWWEELE